MKSLVLIIALFVISVFVSNAAEVNSKIEIKTSSICETCKKTIEGALKKVDGVMSSDLNIETKIVTVEYDNAETNPDEIRNAISKSGYDADGVKRDKRAYKKLPECCKAD